MLSADKKWIVEEAQRRPVSMLRNLDGTQLDCITPEDLEKVKMCEKFGDGVWQLNIEYNGLTLRYAIAYEDGEWYSTMSTPRLRALLSYYIGKISVPVIDLTVSNEKRNQSRKFADMLVGLLYDIPYPIRIQSGTTVYSITANERAIVVDEPHSRQVIPIEGDKVESAYDLKQLCEAVLKLLPVQFYLCTTTKASPTTDHRFTLYKEIGDTAIYHLTDSCVIYKPNSFLISNVDLDKAMPGSSKEIVELLDLYCAMNKEVEFSVSVAILLNKLNVEDEALKLLKKLTDTTGDA